MAKRPSNDQSLHDRAVKDVARMRISADKYDVYTNPNGEHNKSVINQDDDVLYPDVVATRKNGGAVAIIIEVETASSVTDDEAEGQWNPYGRVDADFYLYVPDGYADEAKRLAKQARAKISGFREWWYEDGEFKSRRKD